MFGIEEKMDSDQNYNLGLENFFSAFQTHHVTFAERYLRVLRNFFGDLSFNNRIFMSYKSQADKFLSTDFNIFNYLNTDENALSDYIGIILDSGGVHGQGDLFLNIFLDFLKEGKSGFQEIQKADFSLDREHWADGRIDIFLHHNDTAIIIENKPYANDQKDQLKRYYNRIEKQYKFVFVAYLSKGENPSEISIPACMLKKLEDEKKFRTISFHEFGVNYLKKCYQQCESNKFKFFLNDFMDFLKSRFDPIAEEINETI